MSPIPSCAKCEKPLRQEGRYGDFYCECCDRSANCPHVSRWKRSMRRFGGRKA